MVSNSCFKSKFNSLLKKKSFKIILPLTAILILICCLYFMSSDKNKLIMAVSIDNSSNQNAAKIVMLDIKNRSMVTLKEKVSLFDTDGPSKLAFSPDNKIIAHKKSLIENDSSPVFIYNINTGKDTFLVSPPPSDGPVNTNYIPDFVWLDNSHILYLSLFNSNSGSSDSTEFHLSHAFYCEDIKTKKSTLISFEGIRTDDYISYMTYLNDTGKILICVDEITSNAYTLKDAQITEKVYEYSPNGKSRRFLLSYKDDSIMKIVSIPNTDSILIATNKNKYDLSKYPTIVSRYDTKAKKLEKLYETPSPYSDTFDFIAYSKNNVLLQNKINYETKFFDLDIKTGKYTEVDFNKNNNPLSTNIQFSAFSLN